MTTHLLNLQSEYFKKIQNGEKTVEMRLYDEKRQGIAVGDRITFRNIETEETLTAAVTALERFPDFAALYACYPKEALGYLPHEPADPEDMTAIYPKERIRHYGALAISISLLP